MSAEAWMKACLRACNVDTKTSSASISILAKVLQQRGISSKVQAYSTTTQQMKGTNAVTIIPLSIDMNVRVGIATSLFIAVATREAVENSPSSPLLNSTDETSAVITKQSNESKQSKPKTEQVAALEKQKYVRLNTILNRTGVDYKTFFHNIVLLRPLFPVFFASRLALLNQIKRTYTNDTMLHDKFINIWKVRDELSRDMLHKIIDEDIVTVKSLLTNKVQSQLQQFSWILFVLCKATFFKTFTLVDAYHLMVACVAVVIEAYSASANGVPIKKKQPIKDETINQESTKKSTDSTDSTSSSSTSSTSSTAVAASSSSSSSSKLPPPSSSSSSSSSPSSTSSSSSSTATTSINPVNPSKLQRHLRASTLSRTVLGLIIKRMNGIEMKDAMKHVNRIHEFIYSLHEQKTLTIFVSDKTLTPSEHLAMQKGGISSEFFRAIMHPGVLEYNSRAISSFYWEHLNAQTICSIDERIFIGHSTKSTSGHMSPSRKRMREDLRNPNKKSPGNSASKRRLNNGGIASRGNRFSLPSLPVSVMHDNWLHSVLSRRMAAPTGRVMHFFKGFPEGEETLKRKQELTMKLMYAYMFEAFEAAKLIVQDATVDNEDGTTEPEVVNSPKSALIEASCHSAVQLFWVMVENILVAEERMLGTMDNQRKTVRIGKLLKSAGFHRSLLAICVEVVFVANKSYSWLFPHTMKTFEVKPLVMFTVIGKFMNACPSLPSAFQEHLQWVTDEVVGVHAWSGPSSLFGMLGACAKLLPFVVIDAPVVKNQTAPPQIPSLLKDFVGRIQVLAGKLIYRLGKEVGVDDTSVIFDHIWSVFIYALTQKWWLFQNRHVHHIVVCALYGVCKGHGRNVLFHQIIDAHQRLTQQIVSNNSDLLDIMLKERCNLRLPINAECASSAKGCTQPRATNPAQSTVIGLYNHVMLPVLKGVITKAVANLEVSHTFPKRFIEGDDGSEGK